MSKTAEVEILVSASLVERTYKPRIAGLLLYGICIGSVLASTDAHYLYWLVLAAHSLGWAHVAYAWGKRQPNPIEAEEKIRLVDGVAAGFWIGVLHFQILPSILVVSLAFNNAISIGGTPLLRRCFYMAVLGAVLGATLAGWQLDLYAGHWAQWGALPILASYPAIFGWTVYQLLRRLNDQQEVLRSLSERDALSGLNNRRFLEERIAQEFENYRRHKHDVSLLMIDVDNFKKVNDQFGHIAGDELIRQIGRVLRETTRKTDVVARYGGDEFSVLLPFTNSNQALELVRRIKEAFERMKTQDARMAPAGMSFGIAMPQNQMDHHDRWIEAADSALYRVKKSDQRGGAAIG